MRESGDVLSVLDFVSSKSKWEEYGFTKLTYFLDTSAHFGRTDINIMLRSYGESKLSYSQYSVYFISKQRHGSFSVECISSIINILHLIGRYIPYENFEDYYSEHPSEERSNDTLDWAVGYLTDELKRTFRVDQDEIDRLNKQVDTLKEQVDSYLYRQLSYEPRELKYKTYLMRDTNTGYTKIGKSVNPRTREKTLRGDKPTIDLFFVIEDNVERELHKAYNEHRIRGEWFNLSEEMINAIMQNYSSTNQIAS